MSFNNTVMPKMIGVPLIKIKTSEIIEDLQKNGTIYMNKLQYYRDYEKNTGETVVGDMNEGRIPIHNAFLVNPETNETIQLQDTSVECDIHDCFAYCMFFINPNNGDFAFTDKQKEKFMSFGDTALLITNQLEFIRRIKNRINEMGLDLLHHSISYYNSNEDSANLWFSLMNGMHNIAFWKDSEYAYQQEYRFLIKNDNIKDDHLVIDIGNIEDISKVIKTDQLFKLKFNYIRNK